MDNQTFSVGEIAVICNAPAHARHYEGCEVVITAPLAYREWYVYPTRTDCAGLAYECDFPTGERMCIRPIYLRKRRPPQDWVRIANLVSLPQTVEVLCD